MSKQNWAVKKVEAMMAKHGSYPTRRSLVDDIAKILLTERARSRRVVRALRKHNNEEEWLNNLNDPSIQLTVGYNKACDDILKRLG